jgi:hypothetical protein
MPSITTAAAAAVLSRSSSQRTLVLATEGTKISTSAIITNRMVSHKSLETGSLPWA